MVSVLPPHGGVRVFHDHRMTGKRSTITDVARQAGVSKATVSAVLNDTGAVKDATRERVVSVMELLDYRPATGRAAQGGRGSARRDKSVALLIKEHDNPYYAGIIDGVRYSIPGDYATVAADGSLHLLGRGSVCINTGGEKVFPEEVEEVLKQHSSIRDAVCVGIPDDRFGEVICAVVEPSAPGEDVDSSSVIEHVRARLARYKAPRHVITVTSIGLGPTSTTQSRSTATSRRSRR